MSLRHCRWASLLEWRCRALWGIHSSVLTGLIVVMLLSAAPTVWASAAAVDPIHQSGRVSPDLRELLQVPEHGRTLQVMLVMFQLAAMLIAAKLLGWLCERMKVAGVIGELPAGVIIGPYLLGSIIQLPLHGRWLPLFPSPSAGQWPVNEVIWSLAQLGGIILLFVTGLHTDLKQFVRYIGPASMVALAGVIAPFALGAAVVYIPMFAELAKAAPGESVLIPALFAGAILAATSIGITARVLGDIGKLDSAEGVTILAAAVLDDVLGIIALAIVGGMAAAAASGGAASLSLAKTAVIGGKAFGVWIGLTVLVLLLAKPIERLLGRINYAGAMVGLGLAMAFICSGVAEFFGLAFVIGAYSVGLGMSQTQVARKMMEELRSICDFIVPIFFAALGMLVDLRAVFGDWRIVVFGLVLTAAAIVGKLLGCGMASLSMGFNGRGAYRIGLGMMPRGEVAFIVAGVGLSRNLIGQKMFGVSIMMTLLTTILAPLLLVPAFARGGSGRRRAGQEPKRTPADSSAAGLVIPIPHDLSEVLLARMLRIAETHGWACEYERTDTDIYLLRRNEQATTVRLENSEIHIDATGPARQEFLDHLNEARRSLAADAVQVKVPVVSDTAVSSDLRHE